MFLSFVMLKFFFLKVINPLKGKDEAYDVLAASVCRSGPSQQVAGALMPN